MELAYSYYRRGENETGTQPAYVYSIDSGTTMRMIVSPCLLSINLTIEFLRANARLRYAMHDCFFILPINLTIKSWTFTVFGLSLRSTASVSFPVLLRIMHIYVEERTLTLSSSFNACISDPQHVGESSKSIAGTKCMLLEDQTLTLPSFFNCTILLTSGGILHWVMASVKSVDGIFERRLRNF